MANIRVDTSSVEEVAAQIIKAGQEIEAQLQAMISAARSVEGSWSGTAEQAWQQMISDLTQAASQVAQATSDAGQATSQAAQNYQQTEEGNTAAFGR